jgi:2-dehydro-3-deoxy-D-gluconate 5-dehydrogenase
MKLFDLTGRVALVTGGNGGIGLGIAAGLAQAGATVALVGRNQAKGDEAVHQLQALGARSVFFAADVADDAACRAMVRDAVGQLGRLDILVNNAGINVRKRPEDYTPADWHQVMDTNLSSAFFSCQAAYPELQKAGGGKIINIASMLSLFGLAIATAYSASKGGMVQLTRSLATAWAKDNIQINAVLPGWIETDLTHSARTQVPGFNERVLSRTPAGRWGVPGDLAGIAVFLASTASDFVTGAAIPIDGGYSAQG